MAKPAKMPKLGRLGLQAAIAMEALTARNTADGTLTAARKRGDLQKKKKR
jgi:hypothetical protein